jgi:membrane associated rhomboid family serine protease
MIPIRDKNPTRRFPIVNVTIVAANVLAFVYEVSLGPSIDVLFARHAVIPAHVVAAVQGPVFLILPILSLFTSLFLHGGWAHLLRNMLYLWVFGDNVEDKLGRARFVMFYILCGVSASALHIYVNPTSTMPTVGASGAISGVLGAYLLLFPGARVVTLIPIFFFVQVAELPALVVLGLWFVMQFFYGIASLGMNSAGMGGVAWWAHIGGFVAGCVLVFPLRKYR